MGIDQRRLASLMLLTPAGIPNVDAMPMIRSAGLRLKDTSRHSLPMAWNRTLVQGSLSSRGAGGTREASFIRRYDAPAAFLI